MFGIEIPRSVWTLSGFRRWAGTLHERSPRIHFSRQSIRIEERAQHALIHEPVMHAINGTLAALTDQLDLGSYYMPFTWFTHVESSLSTEPDGFAIRWETFESGRFRLNPRRETEGLGRPDMTLEVVSDSTADKDLKELVAEYAAAGVPEYWIADARGRKPVLRILVLKRGRYRDQKADAQGWIASPFWGREFRLVGYTDEAGLPDFRLEARSPTKK